MLRIVPYQPADLAQIEPHPYEQELREKSGVDYAEVYLQGYAYTVMEDERPVMAGGIVELWPGVGEAWLFLSPWFERHTKTGYRIIKRLLMDVLTNHPFHRLQAPICAAMAGNIRLVEHLGFQSEGLMRRWGPDGKDYRVMAIVAKEGERICLKHS